MVMINQKSQPKAGPPRAEKLKTDKINKPDKLQETQKHVDELTNKWKRALADYQNLEKRVYQERQEFVRFSNAVLINKLLAVLDSLEMAEKHLKDQGLSLAINQLRTVLKDEGVEEIMLDGKKFDPLLMECVEVVEGPANIEIVQKGYYLHKKVIRPAKVKVGSPDKISGNIA
jgi:molecular chaperone GrpE